MRQIPYGHHRKNHILGFQEITSQRVTCRKLTMSKSEILHFLRFETITATLYIKVGFYERSYVVEKPDGTTLSPNLSNLKKKDKKDSKHQICLLALHRTVEGKTENTSSKK